jgi:hypothetical protein
VYYYGNKSFLANKQKIESPMDFFIKNYGWKSSATHELRLLRQGS